MRDWCFYAPTLKDWGHIVLLMSVCLSVCYKHQLHTQHFPVTSKLYKLQSIWWEVNFCGGMVFSYYLSKIWTVKISEALKENKVLITSTLSFSVIVFYGINKHFHCFLAHLSTKCSFRAQSELLWSLTISRRPFTFPCLHSSIYKY